MANQEDEDEGEQELRDAMEHVDELTLFKMLVEVLTLSQLTTLAERIDDHIQAAHIEAKRIK